MNSETPILGALRVSLAPFEPARHFTGVYLGWLNDPRLMRYSEQRHRRHDLSDCAAYIAGVTHMWAIEDHDAGYIGTCAIDLDAPNNTCDLGILVGRMRGTGRGREAWRAMLDFANRRYRRVAAGCMETNDAMKRILDATMTFDYRVKDRFEWEGRAVDALYYRG